MCTNNPGSPSLFKDITPKTLLFVVVQNECKCNYQGSAADIKIAMINIKTNSENLKRNCLQVHDELVFDVHNDEPEKSNR
jgi:hypothetical protein